jgi:hypothetical protein
MLKKICCPVVYSLLFGYALAAPDTVDSETAQSGNTVAEVESENIRSDTGAPKKNRKIDGFMNVKVSHERDNPEFLGNRNASAIGVNPVIAIGDLTLEASLRTGKLFAFSGAMRGPTNLSKITGDTNRSEFYENFEDIERDLSKSYSSTYEKGHFYREYTRAVYENARHNFRVVAGDTTSRNTIGFQQALSGVGVSIFRQEGNGSVINGGSPIVLTSVSKVECKINGEIIAVYVLAPGVYDLGALPEEAKLPGVTLKITDQLNRADTLKVDYFSGYGMLAEGKNDFDLTVVCPHKWDLEDPYKMKYKNKPRYSVNYRYGVSDDITGGIGAQAYENSFTLDGVTIFDAEFGKISPNVAFSYARDEGKTNKAGGIGVFYSVPENDLDTYMEVFAGVKEKKYGDLGAGRELEEAYNAYIDTYITDNARKLRFRNSSSPSSSKQVTARLYTKPIFGIVPAFIFNGEWSASQRLREYTASATTKIECCTLVAAFGLTYDDPSKGRNLRSPDGRLTLACTIDLDEEISVGGSYVYYGDEKRRAYGSLTYRPVELEGLELCAEYTNRPGYKNPCFSAKYDGEFFNLKVEESVVNTYEDKELACKPSHANKQRFLVGTSISKEGFGKIKPASFNVLRGVKK